MHRLAIASDAQVRTLSGQTHVLWGGGLDPDAYLDLWIELCRTDWVRDHATYYVLDDGDGNVLSSLKLYRPRLCWDGHESRIAALAGIFTPASLRRRGYARELIERVLEVAAEDGASLALLFSDIGTRYYRTLGFQELGADEHWMRISGATAGIPSSIELRSLTPAAVDDVVDAHRAYTEGRRFSIVRDKDHWDFILNRAQGFFRRLTGNRSRQRLEVAVRDGRFVGYLFSIEGAGEWNLREVGAAGGSIEWMAEIVRAGLGAAASRGARRCYGWIQPELAAALKDLPLRTETRRRMVPMLRTLGAGDDRQVPGLPDSYIAFQDQF